MSKLITIGILEDNFSLRTSIQEFLIATSRFDIIFSEDAYFNIKHKKYGVDLEFIIIDIHLADVNAIDVVDDIKVRFPSTQVILITGDNDESLLLKAIEKGGSCYIVKPIILKDLIKIIDTLQETGSYLAPELLTTLMQQLVVRKKKNAVNDNTSLTDREADILELVEMGCTYKEIASRLNISYHTVNHHLRSIYIKFDVNSKVELITKRLLNNT